MLTPLATALLLALTIFGLGLLTGLVQLLGLRKLAARKNVPSDEAQYLRNRHRRRLLTAGILIIIALLIAGAYLSGMETNVDNLKPQQLPPGEEANPPQMTEEQKGLVRLWSLYWAGIIVLVFSLTGLALMDVIATRRYWYGIYRELRDEHQAKLRRDLAVYRQQKEQNRAPGLGKPLPSTDASPNDAPPDDLTPSS